MDRIPRWLVLAVVSIAMVLIGGNFWFSRNPPGGSGPWAAMTIIGLFVGIAAAVNLGSSRRNRQP